jgi:hypothetical protein
VSPYGQNTARHNWPQQYAATMLARLTLIGDEKAAI